MLTINENMQVDEALYLDILINFYDFFNILCGCALVIKHSSPNAYNLHSQLGVNQLGIIIILYMFYYIDYNNCDHIKYSTDLKAYFKFKYIYFMRLCELDVLILSKRFDQVV